MLTLKQQKQTSRLLHIHTYKPYTTHPPVFPPTVSLTEYSHMKLWCVPVHLSPWRTYSVQCFNDGAYLHRVILYMERRKCMNAWLYAPVHSVYARMRCVCEGSLCTHEPSGHPLLPWRGLCEVLSAWPLRSPVATGGLLRSTSIPGSQPQKRKFGSFKWRGCSRAIYRALYRSSATHDIPYENQCVWCLWCMSMSDGGWGAAGSGVVG